MESDLAKPFRLETECLHCGLRAKHSVLAISHEKEVNVQRVDSPAVETYGQSLISLRCIACFDLTIWTGHIPLKMVQDHYNAPISYEIIFGTYFSSLYPEIKYKKVWPYSVPRGNIHPSVLYFLEQARTASDAGLYNAGVVSLRSTLEAIMKIHQPDDRKIKKSGFVSLNLRIISLFQECPLPNWCAHLDEESLLFMKEIGNAAVHTANCDANENGMFKAMATFINIILREFYEQTRHELKESVSRLKEMQIK